MGWGAAAMGVASIISADRAADASRDAAQTQAAATREGAAETRRQFEETRRDLSPFRRAGIEALTGRTKEDPRQARLNELKSSLEGMSSSIEQAESGQGGIAGTVSQAIESTKPELQRKRQELQSEIDSLQSDIEQNPFQPDAGPGLIGLVTDPEAQRDFIAENPFFEALADDAQSRIFQNKAARGKVGSGETAEALQNSLLLLGTDLLNQNISQRQNIASMGQNAAAQTGQFGAQAARSIADLTTQRGNALAAGQVGAANARTRGINNAVNSITSLYAIDRMTS